MIGLESITLIICDCSPAALKLLTRGLFPCAPILPSLAVDISLLRFARELFVRLPPNITSLSEAIESFLLGQGYKLDVKVTTDLFHAVPTKSYKFTGLITPSLYGRLQLVRHARRGLQSTCTIKY